MSETTRLTSAQSAIVRNLQKAITSFGETSTYTPDALRTSSHAITQQFHELEAAFPEVAQRATEYYEAELPDMVEEADGYEDALFSLLLELRSFYDAEGFSRVANSLTALHDHVYDLSTFSDEYNVERGFWNADLT